MSDAELAALRDRSNRDRDRWDKYSDLAISVSRIMDLLDRVEAAEGRAEAATDDIARLSAALAEKQDELDTWTHTNAVDELRRRAERSESALDEALAQLEEERARLDWMNSLGAWVEWTMRDGSIRQCQVWTQNEDEEYIVLTGERFFTDERAAIDAARSMTVITGDES